MKFGLPVRMIVLLVLVGFIGLFLASEATQVAGAAQPRLRQDRNVFRRWSTTQSDSPWAPLFDYRQPGWTLAPRTVAVPFASITVTTTADTIDAAANCAAVTLASLPGPGGQTSLREAICAANSNPGPDTITFSVNGTFALTGAANEDNGGTGDFDIKQSLTINGNGVANTILDGSGTERIFDVFPSAATTFDLSNLTIQNGDTRSTSFKEGGAMYLHNNVTSTFNSIQVINNFSGANGAIENRGTLTINNSVISNNQTAPTSGSVVGGGLHNAGTLTIDNSTISNNTVRGEGGGIATTTGAGVIVTITDSTISGNTASITGGGLGNGGGISTTGNQGTINLTNCTISGNRADANGGGAAFVSVSGGAVTLTNVTITNNTADNDNNSSGAGGGFSQGSATTVTLRNTIIAGNFNSTAATRDDISGAVVAGSSFNLIGDDTGMSGITNGTNNNQVGSGASPVNALLGPLANNGGPTETHALLTGSPALDSANNATSPPADQRGVLRPYNGVADKGAYELNDTVPPDTTITSNPTNPSNSSSATFTFIGTDNVTPPGSMTFQCQLDTGGFSACTSPRTYTGLSDGSHTFQVKAVDQAGNTDPTAASFTWVISTPVADLAIDKRHSGNFTQGQTGAQYTIEVRNVGTGPTNGAVTVVDTLPAGLTATAMSGSGWNCTLATLICTRSDALAANSSYPDITLTVNVAGLAPFSVTNSATVSGGGEQNTGNNTDSDPTTVVAETTPPDTTITGNPTNPSNSTSATFTFTGSDNVTAPGSLSFQCQLDGGGFSACTSPRVYTGLSDGTHTFRVQAVDAAGNTDPTPASFTWAIDSVQPTVAFSSAAANPTNTSPIPVTVTFSESVTGFIAGDITTSNGTVSNFAGSGSTYTFDLVPSGQGLVTANLAAGVAQDAAGNGNTAAMQFSRTYDSIPPTVSQLVRGNASPTNAGSVTFNLLFSEIVTNPIAENFTLVPGGLVAGAMITNSVCNMTVKSCVITVNTGSGSGTLGLNLTNSTGVTDSAGLGISNLPYDGQVYTLDKDVPNTTLTANPPNLSNSANATFSFTGNDGGGSGVVSFECKLDAGFFTACTSPQTYTGLSDGSHTFQVRAVDAAGNADDTPASYTWIIDTTAPSAPVVVTPANGASTSNTQPTVSGTAEPFSTVTVFLDSTVAGTTNADAAGNWTFTPTPTLSDGSHTARARATDAAGNTSPDSNTNTFIVDTIAPDTTITANPTNPSASANASFSFTGNDGSGSGVASFQCKLDTGSFTACASPQTYTGLSDGSHTFQVRAVDAAGNTDPTPASFTWVIDATPPDTTLTANPNNPSNSANATFSFTGNDGSGTGVTGFECNLDSGIFTACTSPQTYTGLSQGSHTFQVRALDTAGNADSTPASFTWVVDTVAPDTTNTANPPNPANSANASFSFTGSDPGGSGVSSFECKLDSGAFSACTSPQTYTGLSDGSHTFQVRALDAAGNTDGTPASFTWVIDVTPPDTTITANPPNPSSSTNASFSFTGNDGSGTGVASFECKLDSGNFTACTSPQNYTGLSLGSHTFQVRALDTLGNTDPTPASYTWSLNAPPVLTPTNLARAAGSTTAALTIATATDVETPQQQLVVQISTDGTNFFDTLSTANVTVTLLDQNDAAPGVNPDATGKVNATIITPCNATAGPLNLTLRVTDGGGLAETKPWTLTITPNPPPTLTYNPASVTAGTTLVITPATGPSDNGTFTLGSVAVAPNNGGLGVLLDQSNGVVTILNASLIGTYTVTVTVTDNCGALTNAQLVVTVVCPTIALAPTTLPAATINTAYPPVLTASPAGGNYSFAVTSGLLPAGLTLNSNGSFSGAPTQSGSFNFRVTATGWAAGPGGCTGFRDYVLLVNCPAISLSPASLPNGTVGASYNQSVAASPAGTYSYSVTSGALPGGVTLNPATGALTGTPAASGTFSFTLTAAVGSCTASQSYTVVITCASASFTTTALPNAQAGVAYNQTLAVSPAGSYTFSLVTGSLPPGLNLNAATGQLSGTATATGTYTFSVQALAANGCGATQAFTLAVTCPAITLNPASLPNGTTGAAYNQSLSATPGGNYSFSKTSGSLPPGLTLNSASGVLSGTPTTQGSYTFTITATGFGACTGSLSYTVTITANCAAITLPALPANGTVGVNYSGNLAATTPSGSYTFSVESGALPPGLAINNLFGQLRGKPAAAGSYTFTLKAARSNGCTGTRAYTIVISSALAALARMADYDGDGKSDLSLWSESSGRWQIVRSSDEQTTQTVWGAAGDLTLLGDYDGDGQSDLAVFRPGDATFYIKRSSDGSAFVKPWGLATDVPVPDDYDGDGQTDVAVWRGSNGTWYILRSSDGQYEVQSWGAGYAPYHDVAVPGDYDGDGQTDLAVFRRSTGTWLIKRSSDGQYTSKAWGVGSDVPVAGDYDGDGRSDLAVWRGATGEWFVLQSSDQSYAVTSWGAAAVGDVPAPGDYDGDGRSDLAVWRAPEQTWYIHCSANAAVITKVQGPNTALPVAAQRR
jgi:hypothetical protein